MKFEIHSKNKNYLFIVNLLTLYLIVFGFRGFLFSSNDVADVMSYAKFLNHPDLYSSDFYIQNISNTIPNERIIFAGFISVFGKHIIWVSFFLHAIFSLILFAGIVKIAQQFIKNAFLPWLLVLFLFGPLYGISIGDCELYYNMFIASLMAKSIGIWAIYYLLKGKKNLTFILLIPVSFIHPTVGAQLFLVIAGIYLFNLVFKREYNGITGLLIYLITAGTWLFLLQSNVYAESQIDTEYLFEIFEFRLAHHFFPEYFRMSDWISAIIFIALSFYYFNSKKKHDLLLFILITTLGMVIYSLLIWLFHIEIVLSSQWFKSYIWIELFGLISLMAIIDRYMPQGKAIENLTKAGFLLFWAVGFIIMILIHTSGNYIGDKKHELFYLDQKSAEAKIGLLAQKTTPKDAVFIVPIEFTEFKFYSERSLFIDYKTVVHRKDVLGEWYARIHMIYDIDILDRLAQRDIYTKAKLNLIDKNEAQFLEYRNYGVSHLVVPQNKKLNFPVVAKTESFSIYKIE